MGSFVPWLYYSFYCRIGPKIGYLVLIFVLGTSCIVVSLSNKFSEPEFRGIRAGQLFFFFFFSYFFFISFTFCHADICWRKFKWNYWSNRGGGVRVMMFNTTFKNISFRLWRSVLLVEKTGMPVESHWPVASHWQTLSHNVVQYLVHISISGITTHNFSGDRHWLHRYQLLYDHDRDGHLNK